MEHVEISCEVNKFSDQFLEQVAELFKLLAHPQRLRLLEVLARKKELAVHELIAELGLAQPCVSQHLNRMRRMGLVAGSRRGKEIYYSISDERALSILNCMQGKKS
ncbi:MAG: metalloregulator ArsR/SmtB family transcription factor [bacterium]|nr:metalloregulator ArsR/SmtB family transcription factor [bacterium]